MNIVLDLAIILIIVWGIYTGYRDGFVKTLSKIVITFGCFFIAIKIADALANVILINIVEPYILKELSKHGIVSDNLGDVSQVLNNLPDFLKGIFNVLGFDLNAAFNDTYNNLQIYLHNIISVILTLVVFAIVKPIALFIVKKFDIFNKIYLVGGINKVLGGVIGTALSFIDCIFLSYAIRLILTFSQNELGFLNISIIESSKIFKFIYDINLFS
ncbi:MAG: CvpA family protein [Oscillospiraceae bacterium]